MSRGDALDVGLVDEELKGDLELTVRLIIAVNDAEGPLTQEDIDDLLGSRPSL